MLWKKAHKDLKNTKKLAKVLRADLNTNNPKRKSLCGKLSQSSKYCNTWLLGISNVSITWITHRISLADGPNEVEWPGHSWDFLFFSDDEKSILSLECSDERDLGNYLVCWVSAHEDMAWPVLVTLLTPEAAMKTKCCFWLTLPIVMSC